MRSGILLFLLLLIGCGGNHDIKSLKLHVDKLDDARNKYGEPDTIAREFEQGLEIEYWGYEKDSVALKFVNGKLAEIITAESRRAEDAKYLKEKEHREKRIQAIEDSLSSEIEKKMEELNK